jgi:hypothetical protein
MGELGVDEIALQAFLAQVDKFFPLERAILFGSRARGEELRESDYDLLLVSAGFEGLDFSQRAVEVMKFWKLSSGLEVLCYTPQEFGRKRRQITIVAEVARTGRDLW